MQMLIMWLIPAYLMLTGASWFHIDEKNKTSTILASKFGKRKYLLEYLGSVFISAFLLFFLNLIINYVFSYILNYGNTYFASMTSVNEEKGLILWQYMHPMITNLIYMCTTSIMISLYAVFMSCLSLYFDKISFVFLLSFSLWLVLISGQYSILLTTQPFTEYSIYHQMKIYLACLFVLGISSYFLYRYRVKKDEI